MLLKILFWLFVALDAAGVGLWFVLGLAAAGPSKTHPLAVAAMLLLVPGLVLAGAVTLFVRTQSPWLQLLAFLVVSAPAVALAIGSLVGGLAVQQQQGALMGSTPLTRALVALDQDPGQLATVRTLLAQGADVEAGEEQPLVLAIAAARRVGPEPVQLLLDAGADPNARNQFGTPAWFAATGATVDPNVLTLLLDRGADPHAAGRDGRSGVWQAVNTRNWPAALLLLRRGAPCGGRSPMGLTLLDTLEGHVRANGDKGGVGDVLAAVRTRERGK